MIAIGITENTVNIVAIINGTTESTTIEITIHMIIIRAAHITTMITMIIAGADMIALVTEIGMNIAPPQVIQGDIIATAAVTHMAIITTVTVNELI